jgi:hypothetical protein
VRISFVGEKDIVPDVSKGKISLHTGLAQSEYLAAGPSTFMLKFLSKEAASTILKLLP